MAKKETPVVRVDQKAQWLLNRIKNAKTKKQMFGSLFQKAYRLSQPNRNVFDMRPIGVNPNTYNVQGMDIAWYVFDLTLADDTNIWVNEIVNSLCPANKDWIKFVSGTDVDEEFKPELEKELQKRTRTFMNYIHKSNFQNVVFECFYDVAVSTGFMTINRGQDADRPFIFISNPPDGIYAEEGPYGSFDQYYRDWVKLTADHARVLWPDMIMPELLETNQFGEKLVSLTECMYYNYDKKIWQYDILHEMSQAIVYSRTQTTSNFVGWRVKKLSGETYGRGPAMDAAPVAGTINQAIYDELVSANFRALPMYMGFDDGVFNPNNFKMIPNTVIACSPTPAGTWPLQPVPPAGDITFAQLMVNELRDQIHSIMHAKPLPSDEDPKATATEILKRDQKNIENRAAQYSRVQQEFFGPFVERCLDILKSFGLWTDLKIDGKIIDVKFETPLLTSHDRKEVIDMLEHAQFMGAIMGEGAGMAIYDVSQLPYWAASKLGVDLNIVNDPKKMVKVMSKAKETEQQMMEQAQQNGPV